MVVEKEKKKKKKKKNNNNNNKNNNIKKKMSSYMRLVPVLIMQVNVQTVFSSECSDKLWCCDSLSNVIDRHNVHVVRTEHWQSSQYQFCRVGCSSSLFELVLAAAADAVIALFVLLERPLILLSSPVNDIVESGPVLLFARHWLHVSNIYTLPHINNMTSINHSLDRCVFI